MFRGVAEEVWAEDVGLLGWVKRSPDEEKRDSSASSCVSAKRSSLSETAACCFFLWTRQASECEYNTRSEERQLTD